MSEQKFSISKRIRSFRHPINGIRVLLKEEHNARIHFAAAVIVIILGFILKVNALEWVALIVAIGMVITAEILNTAIEHIADFISPERNEKIKVIKDLAAAAVLISSIVALAIGFIVFLPKILRFI